MLRDGAQILLIRLSALGDVLFALEALASMKAERPDLRVDFLVEDRCAEILRGHPQIERLWVFPRKRKRAVPGSLLDLRRTRYDLLLDLHGNLKSALHVLAARARRKVGFAAPRARDGSWRCYGMKVALPEPMPHRADQGLLMLRAIGLEGRPARAVLPDHEAPAGLASKLGPETLVLHPGTSAFAAFKRWPPAKFAELARRLAARGLPVAISHGPGEASLARRLQGEVPGSNLLDGAALGLSGLAWAYGRSRLVIAADTGPLHLAAAAGTRVVALFGPKDPAVYGPRGEGHRVVFGDVPCRPCRRRRCPSPQCMLGLSVDVVERAVHAALA